MSAQPHKNADIMIAAMILIFYLLRDR
jgi:hypothetical protein